MKRQIKINLRSGPFDYETPDGDLAVCAEFVEKILKVHSAPKEIQLALRATPPTAKMSGCYRAARRDRSNFKRVSVGKTRHSCYYWVSRTLHSIGVKLGQKFWFKITL